MVLEGYNGIVGCESSINSYPIFNIWRATTVIGEQYNETFYKNEDPNKMLRNKEHVKIGIDWGEGKDVTAVW